MRQLLLLPFIFYTYACFAILEPDLDDDKKTQADFCIDCPGQKTPVHAPADLQHLPTGDCGKKCEELLAAAKAEGMRCPHEWAQFKRKRGDACAYFRKLGKDPTQWSKGLCATAIANDFKKVGLPVTPGDAHFWAQSLKNPAAHMKQIEVTDPAKAPRGAILVYSTNIGRGKKRDYGHIEIAMGNEFCSDYCYPVDFITKAPTEHGKLLAAFMPMDG